MVFSLLTGCLMSVHKPFQVAFVFLGGSAYLAHALTGMESCFPDRRLNAGKKTAARHTPMTDENKVSNIASPINCLISVHSSAPTTFRTPTSLARPTDRAVERFIKLIHAISRIKKATRVKSLTYSIRPPSIRPFLKVE